VTDAEYEDEWRKLIQRNAERQAEAFGRALQLDLSKYVVSFDCGPLLAHEQAADQEVAELERLYRL